MGEVATAAPLRDWLQVGADGLARLDRRIFTDPRLFEAEMRHIWEKLWIFVAHESQLPRAHDYCTTQVGRQPVLLIRNASGAVRGFINACRHRGAKLCDLAAGNAKVLRCPYHDWSYSSDGELLSIKEETRGAYPPSFDKSTLGLTPVPHVQSYRGFIFASLDPAAVPLEEHLGDAAKFIDLLVDQSAAGWEVLKGTTTYTYDANWKLQAENGLDMYHVNVVHANVAAAAQYRLRKVTEGGRPPELQLQRPEDTAGGFFDLGRGHSVVWRDWSRPEGRFNYADRDNVLRLMGEVRTRWALGRLRNTLIYPNLMLMDLHSTQLRVIRPLAVDRTQVLSWCIAPVGEDPAQRKRRVRAFLDFFNASGMATPDDLAIFRLLDQGFRGESSPWSDMSRGAAQVLAGADGHARELGIRPVASGAWCDDEGVFVGKYRYWTELMKAAHGA